MAFYYSALNRAFYCSDIVSVDVMPADKVFVTDESYKALMAAQNAGKLIRPGAGGAPEAVDQAGSAATGITHELTVATAQQLGHVKIGAGVNVGADGTISVDTSTLYKQDSWSTRIASTAYAVGDVVDCPFKRNLELVCTQAGTTAAGDLAEGSLTHGTTLTDGSVKWKVRAKIKTINEQETNANGSVNIDVGVKTVNSQKPDSSGNVNVDISSKRDHTIQIANADLNTLLEDKTWSCSGTLKNTPIPCTFCIVQAYDTGAPVSGNIVQVCYIPNQTNNTVRAFWRNCLNGATFGAWSESGAVKTVNSITPDDAGNVNVPNATTSKFGLVRLAAEEDVLKESPQTAVCTQLIYEINEFRRKSTAYLVGEKVDCAFQYERFLECTKAGTTSADMLDTRDVTHGQVITDGTVEWTVRTHVRSINDSVAGADGNVLVDVGVKKINGNGPDSSGNITPSQTGCLPLSGGQMTGGITWNGKSLYEDSGQLKWNGQRLVHDNFYLGNKGNGISLTFGAGTSHDRGGGSISLWEANDPDINSAGNFALRAVNADGTNVRELFGNLQGGLHWDTHTVLNFLKTSAKTMLSTDGSTVTVPFDGLAYIKAQRHGAGGGYLEVFVDNSSIGSVDSNNFSIGSMCIPLKRGQTFRTVNSGLHTAACLLIAFE